MANGLVTGDQRREVWWIGAVPPGIETELNNRRLQLILVAREQLISRPKHALRAVVLPLAVEAATRAILADAFFPVLDSGAALLIALPNPESEEADQTTANIVISTLKRAETQPTVRTVPAWEAPALAQFCLEHDPGLAEATGLIIKPAADLMPSHHVLLRRAFSDFATIDLVPLLGGFSKARLWRVDASDRAGRQAEPFVAKAGPREKITSEIDRIRNFVLHQVPFPHHPSLVLERCVQGATERLCVSMFVDRAVQFDNYLVKGSPRLIITALFDGPLRRWRSNRIPAEVRLGDAFEKFRVLPPTEELVPAYELARAVKSTVRTALDLSSALRGLPAEKVQLMLGHGDLNIRNIHVRRDTTEVVLIDYAKAGEESPASRDPATLDVSLALDAIDGLPSLQDVIIRKLYARPLLPAPLDLAGDGRIEAIRQLRREVAGDGVNDREYSTAVACYLLRFAAFEDHAEMRGLAYEIADSLI